jgi:hypothetical protein
MNIYIEYATGREYIIPDMTGFTGTYIEQTSGNYILMEAYTSPNGWVSEPVRSCADKETAIKDLLSWIAIK